MMTLGAKSTIRIIVKILLVLVFVCLRYMLDFNLAVSDIPTQSFMMRLIFLSILMPCFVFGLARLVSSSTVSYIITCIAVIASVAIRIFDSGPIAYIWPFGFWTHIEQPSQILAIALCALAVLFALKMVVEYVKRDKASSLILIVGSLVVEFILIVSSCDPNIPCGG